MAGQIEDASDNINSLTRALSLPLFALVLALVLIYLGPPSEPIIGGQIIAPDKLDGYRLHLGLRDIAIVFGLSCFPSGLIGAMLGHLILIAQNSKLASASISLLRIGQWAPFVIWWVLVLLLFEAPGQQRGRYFFDWTMGIPAVALGYSFHILCTRHLLRLDWRRSVSESMALACHRALFISLVLALSVWSENWVVAYTNDNATRHYVAAVVLALFLLVVDWLNNSGIEQSAKLQRQIILADLNSRNDGSTWLAAFIIFFVVVIWHLFGLIGNFSVSPVRVFNAAVTLFSEGEIWRDMRISLLEIFAGVMFSGALAFIVSATLLANRTIRKLTFSILSLTFAIPMVMLPAWHDSLFSRGHFIWYIVSVACLSFFPMMHIVWVLREELLLCRIFLATERALPYAFAATLWSQMMTATAGLGFATIVASATIQTEKAFAIFLLTLTLLFGLSSTLRLLARWSYSSSNRPKENQIPTL